MMKKIIACFLVLAMCLSLNCFAAHEQYELFGISYDISENWDFLESDLIGVTYQYDAPEFEALLFYVIALGSGVDMTDSYGLSEFLSNRYSNENLSADLSETNGVTVSVTENKVDMSYEEHGGVLYFKYHKEYTASAEGYRDNVYYITAYVCNPNDNLYLIVHDRESKAKDHTADVTAVIDSIKYTPGEIKIIINDYQIYPDSAPMIVNDRTMVPIRAVAEALGFTVGWDGENQTASVTSEYGESVYFKINSNTATKSTGEVITLDSAAFIHEDRTYLPLRAVAEALGASVDWDGDKRAVIINYSTAGGIA